jgi:hypothetical protein
MTLPQAWTHATVGDVLEINYGKGQHCIRRLSERKNLMQEPAATAITQKLSFRSTSVKRKTRGSRKLWLRGLGLGKTGLLG